MHNVQADVGYGSTQSLLVPLPLLGRQHLVMCNISVCASWQAVRVCYTSHFQPLPRTAL